MAEIGGFAQAFAGALAEVAPVLDERARRLLMGAAARQLGRGGITLIAAATGASKDTVGRGAGELEAGVVVVVGSARRVRGANWWSITIRGCGRRWTSWWIPRPAG